MLQVTVLCALLWFLLQDVVRGPKGCCPQGPSVPVGHLEPAGSLKTLKNILFLLPALGSSTF